MLLIWTVLLMIGAPGFAAPSAPLPTDVLIRFQPGRLDQPCELRLTAQTPHSEPLHQPTYRLRFRPGTATNLPSEWITDEAELTRADELLPTYARPLSASAVNRMSRFFFGQMVREMLEAPRKTSVTDGQARQFFANQTPEVRDLIRATATFLETGRDGYVLRAYWRIMRTANQNTAYETRVIVPDRTVPRGLLILPYPDRVSDDYAPEFYDVDDESPKLYGMSFFPVSLETKPIVKAQE